MLIEIEKVIVNDRIRKDFGNIEELAHDIKENGLINPPVVTPEFELIAGERRYRAMKSLGWKQIEVRVMSVQDALHKLKLEISENENRKEFSFNERMEWARLLEEEYKKKAKLNMSKGGEGVKVGQCCQTLNTNKEVSKSVDMSEGTYKKAKYIYENADDEMIKQLDDGKLSINGAYVSLKNKAKELEDKTKSLEQEKLRLQSELNNERCKIVKPIDNTDYESIDRLKQEINCKNKEIDKMKVREEYLTDQMKVYERNSNEYDNLKRELENLMKRREEVSRSIHSATELSGLVAKIDGFIKRELAPINYSSSLNYMKDNCVVQQNIRDIVGVVQKWCNDMNEYIEDNNKNIINVEVM